MKKLIVLLCLCFAIISQAETVQIIGLIVKKKPGYTKFYTMSTNGKKQIKVKIKYIARKEKNMHEFKIGSHDNKLTQTYTYYMKDDDKINFKYWTFRIIEFNNFFWFKPIIN
jgi:hypothetical protein